MLAEDKKCDKGFKEMGTCCCNCVHQMKLFKHPWNSNYGKGSIKDQMGFICKAGFPEDGVTDEAYYFEKQHGMCENWQEK